MLVLYGFPELLKELSRDQRHEDGIPFLESDKLPFSDSIEGRLAGGRDINEEISTQESTKILVNHQILSGG